MQSSLTGYILAAEEVEMEDKQTPGKKVKMLKLTMLDSLDGTTRTDWVTAEKPKGFSPKFVAKVVGQQISATYKETNYDGIKKTVLDYIAAI